MDEDTQPDFQRLEDFEHAKVVVECLRDPAVGDLRFSSTRIDILNSFPELEPDLNEIRTSRNYLKLIRERLNASPRPITLRAKLRLMDEAKLLDEIGYGRLCMACETSGDALGRCDRCEFIDEDHNRTSWRQRAERIPVKK